jgi:hypothetical protein
MPAPHLVPTGDPTGASQGRMLAVPQAVAARARPEEAADRTQFDVQPRGSASGPPPPDAARPFVAGAQTDLSTARDASIAELREATAQAPKKRSPLIYALPVVALLAGAGIVSVVVGKAKGNARTTPSATTVQAPPSESPLPNLTNPPPSATPSAAPSAELAVVPSARASASASVARPSRPPATPAIVTTPKPGNTSLQQGLIP